MKKTMSLKQIAANRRNARKSTGPRTLEGKTVAKFNALKHGILSREVVVRGWRIRESSREFDSLRKRFWQEYAPVGPVEEMLVDRIVSTYWRMRRAVTAETGEVSLNVDSGHWKRNGPNRFRNQLITASMFGDMAANIEETATGLYVLMDRLCNVRTAVERNGELTDKDLQETYLAGKPNYISKQLDELRTAPMENAEGLDEVALKAKRKDVILATIDRLLGQYERQKRETREYEHAEESARQAAAVLPSVETLDKIMRYETTLERQMYRAMNELERQQRRRQGEAVPPPLTMEVAPRC